MQDRELSLAVVGIPYANNDKSKSSRLFEMMVCERGEPITLRREPRNPKDPNAVAVFSVRGVQLGYLTAERAPWIGGKLLQGEEIRAIFQEGGPTAAIIRVRFGGGAPTLPPPRPPRPAGPDEASQLTPAEWDNFYPDVSPVEYGDLDAGDGIDPDGPEWGA